MCNYIRTIHLELCKPLARVKTNMKHLQLRLQIFASLTGLRTLPCNLPHIAIGHSCNVKRTEDIFELGNKTALQSLDSKIINESLLSNL